MAEFAQTQPVVQRLLHQDTQTAGQAGKRRLLGAAPRGLRHVRQREPAAAKEEVQTPQERQGDPGKRTGGSHQHKQNILLAAEPPGGREPGAGSARPAGARRALVPDADEDPGVAGDLHKTQEVLHHREPHLARQADAGGAKRDAHPAPRPPVGAHIVLLRSRLHEPHGPDAALLGPLRELRDLLRRRFVPGVAIIARQRQ